MKKKDLLLVIVVVVEAKNKTTFNFGSVASSFYRIISNRIVKGIVKGIIHFICCELFHFIP